VLVIVSDVTLVAAEINRIENWKALLPKRAILTILFTTFLRIAFDKKHGLKVIGVQWIHILEAK